MKIELKPWTQENQADLIRVCSCVNRTYLSERLPQPYTRECARWWYDMVLPQDGKTGIFRALWVDGKIVGNVTVEPKQDIYRKDTEIGYLLDPEYEGRGIMTEAVRQICQIAFQELDIERITGYVFAGNGASQRVLLKNGFRLEGIMKRALYKNGQVSDLHIYGKCREA